MRLTSSVRIPRIALVILGMRLSAEAGLWVKIPKIGIVRLTVPSPDMSWQTSKG